MLKRTSSLLLILCFSGLMFAGQSIQIKGSDTLINLVQRLSEVYMGSHPEATISVTGGGSGTGIAALLNNKTNIANASRLIKSKETDKAKKHGIKVEQVVIAIDALSVITHPSNPVKALSLQELGAIFRGEITNWKAVGGPDLNITLYGRQSNSGTFSFFRKRVLQGDYSNHMNRMNGNSQIVESIKRDKSGIGYVGVGYVVQNDLPIPDIYIVAVSEAKDQQAYFPYDTKAVGSGKYPITRGLNQYLNGKPKGLTRSFLQFELSTEGQKIVKQMGFYPVAGDIVKNNDSVMRGSVKFF